MATAAAVVLVAGCGAGPNATTQLIDSPGDGVTRYEDRIRVLNALVFPPVLQRPAPVLSVGVANEGAAPDELSGIEIGSTSGSASDAWVQISGPRTIPADGVLYIATGSSPTTAYLCGGAFPPGTSVDLTFRFARAESVENLITIVAPVGGYHHLGGLPIPLPNQPPDVCATPPPTGT